MITCYKLHDSFRRKINRRNTSWSTYPPVADIDQYLAEAIGIVLTTLVRAPEKDDITRNILKELEVKDLELEIECFDDHYVSKLPENYFFPLNFTVTATKDGCEECGKRLIPRRVRSREIEEALKDPYRKPSYEYEEILYDEMENGVKWYTNGEFNVTKVTLSYYRKIIPPKCPSLAEKGFYISPDEQRVDKDTHFELDSTYIHDDITDIASFLFLRDVGDAVDADAKLKSIGIKYKLI
jgi:hypothetical protein